MDLVPAETFLPGEYIQDELTARNLSVDNLANIMAYSADYLKQVIDGKEIITVDLADRLARAFGTSSGLWLNLQASFPRV
jgi:addiction module HigA family antidote